MPMETINLEYKGWMISHLKIPLESNRYTVNLASNDRLQMAKIGGSAKVFVDHTSCEGAIAQAKLFVDALA